MTNGLKVEMQKGDMEKRRHVKMTNAKSRHAKMADYCKTALQQVFKATAFLAT